MRDVYVHVGSLLPYFFEMIEIGRACNSTYGWVILVIFLEKICKFY